MEPLTVACLLGWATLTGLDLVSWPQGLLARPLVAGTVAGLLLGDPLAGLQVGTVLELFALDVLPVGAARYPDYGAAAVAGTLAASAQPSDAFGLGVGLGLILAVVGGLSMAWHRRLTTRHVAAAEAALAVGDEDAIRRLHLGGLARDGVRSAGIAVAALLGGWLLVRFPPEPTLGRWLSLSLTAAGVAAAGAGALRCAGRGLRLRWLTVGTALGLLAVVTLR